MAGARRLGTEERRHESLAIEMQPYRVTNRSRSSLVVHRSNINGSIKIVGDNNSKAEMGSFAGVVL